MFIEITGDSEIIGVYDLSSFNWRVQKTHGHQNPHRWRYDVPGRFGLITMMRPKSLGRPDDDVAFLTLMGMDRRDHADVCDVK